MQLRHLAVLLRLAGRVLLGHLDQAVIVTFSAAGRRDQQQDGQPSPSGGAHSPLADTLTGGVIPIGLRHATCLANPFVRCTPTLAADGSRPGESGNESPHSKEGLLVQGLGSSGQPFQRGLLSANCVGFHTHAVEHGEVEVRQRGLLG